MPTRSRATVIGRIADHLVARPLGRPLRVAVDGVTAAGKTTLATEPAAAVRLRGRPAVHLTMDGFHHPSTVRHRQGRDSAAGYHEDAYDLDAPARPLLDGVPDAVTGHRTDWVDITDPEVVAASGSARHPVVRPTGDAHDVVTGTVLTLTPTELAAADTYEVDDYRRVLVRLRSGVESWMYLAADPG